jgi:hypothetical protein
VREYFKPTNIPTETCNLHNEWTQRVITEDASAGQGGNAPATPRRKNDVDRILDGLKKGLGRIFGGRPR